MDILTKGKFKSLKEESFKKSKGFEVAYNNIYNDFLDKDKLVENLLDLELPFYVVLLIGDLLMKESEDTRTEIFKTLTLFTEKGLPN